MKYIPRQHERVKFVAPVTIRSRDGSGQPVKASMFNASKGGVAVFSNVYFPPGTAVDLAISLPIKPTAAREIVMAGLVKRARVQPDGDELGIEFLPDGGNGQLEWLGRHLDQRVGDGVPWRHRRINLVVDVTVRPEGRTNEEVTGSMFNVSKSGAAAFLRKDFAVGSHLTMMFAVHTEDGVRNLAMECVVRRSGRRSAGNMLGLEFVPGASPSDHQWFAGYLGDRERQAGIARKRAFTLVEACIAMTIICLLVTMATPIYIRAMEQARADAAAANLRSVWSAQRIYWLEQKTFAPSLAALESMDLVDPALAQSQVSPDAAYVYSILDADSESFLAAATRSGSGIWNGQLQIDQDGTVIGAITGPGEQQISPAD